MLLSGHYGSGKTNIAVNLAADQKNYYDQVAIADIDIVNPYFRTSDSRAELEKKGIRLICSEFAGSNVDLPALPQEVYAIVDEPRLRAIVDVGGDDRGALALGRWRDAILAENDYEMLFVVNMYRPLTRDAASAVEIMHEIETAAGMRFTAVVNNSNIGDATEAEDVLASENYAAEICEMTDLPLKMTCIDRRLEAALRGRIENLFSLKLQDKIR